ncbi:MAG: 30S ribosomal protein S6 [Clostridiales bacterium]|jgi:small subunit ribosomal protein S6|nr:30S ribosomal protein S6 [Clostridiales bacterium]
MAKVSAKYETVYIIRPDLGEEDTAAIIEKFKTLAAEHGTVDNIDVWGKRRLAYEINDFTEGYYVLMNVTATPDFPAELDRVFKITDGILRSIIVCKD